MVRLLTIVVALGLVASSLAGAALHATPWLRWLDILAAGAALGFIWRATNGTTAAYLVGVSIFCLVLWVVGLVTVATPWLAWVTFGHGLAFLCIAILSSLAPIAVRGFPLAV
jgi:hypothetical protein